MKQQQDFMTDLERVTTPFEQLGLGGTRIWVARDATGVIYCYTDKPEWNEETGRWCGSHYGTFVFDAYPWVTAGMCVGFTIETIDKEFVKV